MTKIWGIILLIAMTTAVAACTEPRPTPDVPQATQPTAPAATQASTTIILPETHVPTRIFAPNAASPTLPALTTSPAAPTSERQIIITVLPLNVRDFSLAQVDQNVRLKVGETHNYKVVAIQLEDGEWTQPPASFEDELEITFSTYQIADHLHDSPSIRAHTPGTSLVYINHPERHPRSHSKKVTNLTVVSGDKVTIQETDETPVRLYTLPRFIPLVIEEGRRLQLNVIAQTSSGAHRDVTGEVRYTTAGKYFTVNSLGLVTKAPDNQKTSDKSHIRIQLGHLIIRRELLVRPKSDPPPQVDENCYILNDGTPTAQKANIIQVTIDDHGYQLDPLDQMQAELIFLEGRGRPHILTMRINCDDQRDLELAHTRALALQSSINVKHLPEPPDVNQIFAGHDLFIDDTIQTPDGIALLTGIEKDGQTLLTLHTNLKDTTIESANPDAARINDLGLLEKTGNGTTLITLQNQGRTASLEWEIEPGTTQPDCTWWTFYQETASENYEVKVDLNRINLILREGNQEEDAREIAKRAGWQIDPLFTYLEKNHYTIRPTESIKCNSHGPLSTEDRRKHLESILITLDQRIFYHDRHSDFRVAQ